MKFQKGQSGNPAGRKPGLSKIGKIRQGLEAHLPEILEALTAQAKAGDPQAAKLLLDRVLPSLKPETRQSTPASTDPGAILEAVERGAIGLDQATALMALAAQRLKIAEGEEMIRRIEALEALLKTKQGGLARRD